MFLKVIFFAKQLKIGKIEKEGVRRGWGNLVLIELIIIITMWGD